MTVIAFGSLWLSSHPGLSSMGKLLALSLACTLASAALFQPALMGPPRQKNGERSTPGRRRNGQLLHPRNGNAALRRTRQ
jgi:hypothetical protein